MGFLIIGLCACAGERRPPEPAATPPAETPETSDETAGPVSLIAEIPPEIAPNRPRDATRLLTYPWVSAAARGGNTITTIDDLVIEERPGERRYDFARAVDVVTDAEGRIYVHDSGSYRVVAYQPNGAFARQYGSLDDAPFHLGWIAWSGGRLVMSTGTMVTVFAPDGEHLFDRSLLRYAFHSRLSASSWPVHDVRGTTDGGLVGAFYAQDETLRSWYSVEKRSLDDDATFTYWAVPVPERGSSSPRAQPGFAATQTGALYMTRGDEYAVQAFAPDGAARWLLHVLAPEETGPTTSQPGRATSRPGRGAFQRGRAVSQPDPAASQPGPPALSVAAGRSPGLGHPLHVDGHGNLYVFPYVAAADERGRVPVDVYSPAGDRLFAGWIEQRSWLEASGDFVYGIEGQEGAQRIVRYRLRAPFLADERAERDP